MDQIREREDGLAGLVRVLRAATAYEAEEHVFLDNLADEGWTQAQDDPRNGEGTSFFVALFATRFLRLGLRLRCESPGVLDSLAYHVGQCPEEARIVAKMIGLDVEPSGGLYFSTDELLELRRSASAHGLDPAEGEAITKLYGRWYDELIAQDQTETTEGGAR